MKVAISQPTFLPWQGYFALIDHVDYFFFLDNVQFLKRSWIQRNKIKSNDKEFFLTIPVKTKNKYLQEIKDVEIDYDNFKIEKILKTIKTNYSKTKFFDKYYETIESILKKKENRLMDLNVNLIERICSEIGINTSKKLVSQLDYEFSEKKTDLLKKICQIQKCNYYISTIGAKSYMGHLDKFEGTEIKINFFDYLNMKYHQIGQKFLSHLSIIDLLFNEGPNTLKILRKNFRIV